MRVWLASTTNRTTSGLERRLRERRVDDVLWLRGQNWNERKVLRRDVTEIAEDPEGILKIGSLRRSKVKIMGIDANCAERVIGR